MVFNHDFLRLVTIDKIFDAQVRSLAHSMEFVPKRTWTKSPEAMMADELLTGERRAIGLVDPTEKLIAYLDYKIKADGSIGIGFCATTPPYRGRRCMTRLFAYFIAIYAGRLITVGTTASNNSMEHILREYAFEPIDRRQDRVNGEISVYYRRLPTDRINTAPSEIIPAPSGIEWYCYFPTSTSLADLTPTFRPSVERFVAALVDAGASPRINATYRPPERAYLMHYAYLIAHQEIEPQAVPAYPDVPIRWLHVMPDGTANRELSVKAAEQLVRAYEIAYPPALHSRHTEGRAIDMMMEWSNHLTIIDGSGQPVCITSTPSTGAKNSELHAVGATYGVLKRLDDAPHWSDDGV